MHYVGKEHLDAEIEMNFGTRELTFDYSKNQYSSSFDSNGSYCKNNEFRQKPLWYRIPVKTLVAFVIPAISIPTALIMAAMSMTERFGVCKNETLHYHYQKFLGWSLSKTRGVLVQESNGAISTKAISFIIPNNVMVDYSMSGEYSEFIQSVKILRNIMQKKTFGIWSRDCQYGWKVVFEFSSPPRNGFARISSIAN